MHAITPKILFATALLACYVAASSPGSDSDYTISGFDVKTLGVGANGATTYVISPDASGVTLQDGGVDGPATIVNGASTFGLTYIDPTSSRAFFQNCGISDGVAVCTDVAELRGATSFTTTTVVTETLSTYPVQATTSASVSTTSTGVTSTRSITVSASGSTTTNTTQNKTSDGVKAMFTPSYLLLGSVVAILMVL
ncbi:uncharacterized protein FIBRA_02164 [Fibroporia radiculosa]|uniref:Uncharacterized protein n=1 Tax=Fibroporia radiculosa TaxID=599839 RepID=J4HUG6_9APHY|nr:uncharacterized protein FIBRA_02164 [Fibroporia radiculosa]CCM00137.1 predicted protein [Fibroporia radiculosa]